MRAVSKKRAAQNRLYMKLRAEYLREHPVCEFPDCGRVGDELHHRRGRVGPDLTDPAHFAALCHPHHVYVTEHPTEAIVLGLSESRLGRTA